MESVQEYPHGIAFRIVVQPRSSKTALQGVHGDALKIKLTAPPVSGAANKMCIAFLAGCLKVPKSALEIKSGQSSRTKQILCRFSPDQPPAERKRIKDAILDLYGET